MRKIPFALVILVCFSSPILAQSNDPLEKETLKGLTGMYLSINISEDSPSLEQDGLTKSQIQTDVEIRLRKAGIRVLSLEEVKQLLK